MACNSEPLQNVAAWTSLAKVLQIVLCSADRFRKVSRINVVLSRLVSTSSVAKTLMCMTSEIILFVSLTREQAPRPSLRPRPRPRLRPRCLPSQELQARFDPRVELRTRKGAADRFFNDRPLPRDFIILESLRKPLLQRGCKPC